MNINLCFLCSRDSLCPAVKDDWLVPQVSQSLKDLFDKGNWSMKNPSPLCECSCEGRKRMLPECPAGAGGLPPPQVGDTIRMSKAKFKSSKALQCQITDNSTEKSLKCLFFCLFIQMKISDKDTLQNLTGRNVSDYLVKTYANIIGKR